ncbi:MAG: PDZ domain-containing protein [Planctomycetota bacterium]
MASTGGHGAGTGSMLAPAESQPVAAAGAPSVIELAVPTDERVVEVPQQVVVPSPAPEAPVINVPLIEADDTIAVAPAVPATSEREYDETAIAFIGIHAGDYQRKVRGRDHKKVQIRGALVIRLIPGTAAVEAGLRKDDVILGVDDHDTGSYRELRGLLVRAYHPGQAATLRVLRDGEELQVAITLCEDPHHYRDRDRQARRDDHRRCEPAPAAPPATNGDEHRKDEPRGRKSPERDREEEFMAMREAIEQLRRDADRMRDEMARIRATPPAAPAPAPAPAPRAASDDAITADPQPAAGRTLSINELLGMVAAGYTTPTILSTIAASRLDFPLDMTAIRRLIAAGCTDEVIDALLARSR